MHNCKRRLMSGALVILLLSAICGAPFPGGGAGGSAFASEALYPDLTIASVEISPNPPSIGNTLTFTVSLRNEGDAGAGTSQITGYIDGTSAGTIDSAAIAAGELTAGTFIWKAQPGPHIFRAVADSGNSVAEANEDNNDSALAFTVIAPDLAIDAISWTPENPSDGDTVTFTVNLINQGDKKCGVSHLDFFIDGNSRGYHTILGIEAGASVNDTFKWSATSGWHNIRAEADALSQVTESDETNNTSEATCATALPDLIISSLTITPVNTTAGDNVTVKGIIKNQGTGRAEPSRLDYYIDDILTETIVTGYLNPGDTENVTFEWITESKPRMFKMTADSGDKIRESDETNNSATIPSPLVLPDLIIQDISWSPSSPIINEIMFFTISVKNQGKCPANYIELKYGFDTIHQFNTTISELSVNGTSTTKIMWTPIYPTFTVNASVDTSDKISESNETNNTLTKRITAVPFTPSADLAIEALTASPPEPVTGDTVTVTLGVKNHGSGTAAACYAALQLDGKTIDDVYIDELAAGAALTKEIVLPLQEFPYQERHRVDVTLDRYDKVPETDETNNRKEMTFHVSVPDLAIQSIRWTPETPAPGERITFDIIVKNRGDYRAGAHYISYYVDQVFMGQHRIDGLEPGATSARSFTWTVQKESFQFTAFIDEDGEVSEKDETNNTMMVDLPAPDLAVDSITWMPGAPDEFTPITFTVRVSNHGSGKAAVTALACDIDGVPTISPETGEIGPGGTSTVVFTYAFVSGEHTIKLTADGNNTITENNEGDNEKTAVFYAESIVTDFPPASDNASSANVTAPTGLDTTGTGKAVAPPENAPAATAAPDITDNLTASPPMWQNLLQNKLLIIGVAAGGIAAIGVLMLLRRRAAGKQAAESSE